MVTPPVKKRGRPKLAENQELIELRKRAMKLNRAAKARVELKLRVLPEVFERLCDIAEADSTPVSVVATNAMIDGLQRYGEFSARTDRDALVKVTPMRAYAKALNEPSKVATAFTTGSLRAARPLVERIVDEISENDPAYIHSQKMQRIAADISTPLPNSPQLQRIDTMPVAPVPVEEDLGLAE
jgi:hypothetical protein